MAKAEFTGIDNVIAYIGKYPVTKLELFQGSRCVYEDHKGDNDTSEDLLNRFIIFAEAQPEHNYATYKLDVSFKKPGNKTVSKISPNISFNPPPGGEYINPYKKKEMATSPTGDPGFTTREFIEASTRMHILADENQKLKEELAAIEAENEELESRVPEGSQPQNIGAVLTTALYSNADKIIALLADKLFGSGGSPSMGLAGIPGEADVQSLVNQMMLIEPEFPAHLEMLINLRKNKPAIYSMALGQLKSL